MITEHTQLLEPPSKLHILAELLYWSSWTLAFSKLKDVWKQADQ